MKNSMVAKQRFILVVAGIFGASDAMATDFVLASSWLDGVPDSSTTERVATEFSDAVQGALDEVIDDADDAPVAAADKSGGGKSKSQSSSNESSLDVGAVKGDVAPMGMEMGIGLQIGSPTALTLKYMLAGNQGIAGGIGVGLGGLSLHIDYLWHPHVLARADPFRLSWYVGLGGWVGFLPFPTGNNFLTYAGPVGVGYTGGYYGVVYVPAPFSWWAPSVAVRVPLGMSLALTQLPIEIYGGVTPSLLVFPGLGFGMGFEVGARFYF